MISDCGFRIGGQLESASFPQSEIRNPQSEICNCRSLRLLYRPQFEELRMEDEKREGHAQQRRGEPNFEIVSWRAGTERPGHPRGQNTVHLRQRGSDESSGNRVQNTLRRVVQVRKQRSLK